MPHGIWWLALVVGLTVAAFTFGGGGAGAPTLDFAEGSEVPLPARTWITYDQEYLRTLRTEFALDDVVAGAETDLERIQMVTEWVSGMWKHHPSNVPSQGDPLTILREAAEGQRFRCVEYGTVTVGSLQALGIPTGSLNLKTADVEMRSWGAGHVVAEAYLWDLEKWVFVDPQWNAMPLLDGVPLNAVEFQAALAADAPGLVIAGVDEGTGESYKRWIAPYLYYFDHGLGDGRTLMLGPVGAPQPTVFQRTYPLGNLIYTHSVELFYQAPAWSGSR